MTRPRSSVKGTNDMFCVIFTLPNKDIEEIHGPYATTEQALIHLDSIKDSIPRHWTFRIYSMPHFGWPG